MPVRPGAVAVYAAATASVPLLCVLVAAMQPIERVAPVDPETIVAEADAEGAEDVEAVRALAGLWWKQLPGTDGSPVGFYYFHGDGKGLYRYGKVGLNNTHSFDYSVRDGQLVLEFRKTGVRHAIEYRVESDGDIDWLTLGYDPEEQAHGTRYFRDRPGPIAPHAPLGDELGTPPAGHMWIDLQPYATGGGGFHFYQFRPAGIDGRGVGWFHRGDFDDWSTEAFTYRIAGDVLDVHFTIADQGEMTRFVVEDGDPRMLRLQTDPRDYWHPHAYVDMGVSFGGMPASLQLAAGLADYSRTE